MTKNVLYVNGIKFRKQDRYSDTMEFKLLLV